MKWKIIDPIPEEEREKWQEQQFESYVNSMDVDELRRLAISQNQTIYKEEQKVSKLEHIAAIAHHYLSDPKEAKKDLVLMLVKSGFWIPRIKKFKPVHVDSDDHIYFVTATNIIGETKLFGHVGKQKNILSFSAWIDDRIPIKYWNIYQVDILDKDLINGKCVMKIPYQEPEDGLFNLNISGARDFNDDTIFIIAKANKGPSLTTYEYNSWADFKDKMDES